MIDHVAHLGLRMASASFGHLCVVLESQTIHVWNIYQHRNPINDPNVGKYTIHGSSGNQTIIFWRTVSINGFSQRRSGARTVVPRDVYSFNAKIKADVARGDLAGA